MNSSLQIDSEHIEAILALGWFHLNIQDDVQKALPLFTRAIDIAKSQLTEAIIGTANCLCEVSSVEEALKYLNDVGEGLLNEEEIRGAQNDIEQMIRDV